LKSPDIYLFPHLPCDKITEEIRVEETLCSLSWSVHSNLAHEGYSTFSPSVAVYKQVFRHGHKNTLFLVMVYSALFNIVFKALNFFSINM